MKKRYKLLFLLLSWVGTEYHFMEVDPTNGPSMEPTFYTGDKVLVTRAPWWKWTVGVGDTVIIATQGPIRLLKRVTAVEGDTVSLTSFYPEIGMSLTTPYDVPEGCLWVEGDNKSMSTDSRAFGPVWKEQVYGVPIMKWRAFAWLFVGGD